MLHCIALETGPRLNQLAKLYELIWASGWEDRANDHLPDILGVPELPYLTFDGRARFGTAHWKLEALDEYAGSRPLAWIDDSLDASCYEWGERAPGAHPPRPDRVRRRAHSTSTSRPSRPGCATDTSLGQPGARSRVDSPGWERWCRSSSWP